MTIRLIGGEMLAWSDLDGGHGPGPVRGSVLAPLLGTAHGRTLVAGPHDPALIDALEVTDLTLLVRGVPDAEALAARYADRPGVAVWCGSPEKLAGEPPFDTVIALDGLARLSSVEGVQLSWSGALELLIGALRPGGRLLISVENLLGLHRLVALPPALTDADWTPSDASDPTRPAGLPRVRARLNVAGLAVGRVYAAFPDPSAPTALVGPEILADEDVHGFLEATVGRACIPLDATLTDPARLAVRAVRNGAATELAPAWILLAQREPAGEMFTSALPVAIVVGGTIHEGWTLRSNGVDRPLPDGRTLEDLLISAALQRDLPALRDLLGSWQSGAAAGVPADQVVVGPDGTSTALVDPVGSAAAIRAFAAALIRGGFAHPFAATVGEADLAAALALMAGVALDPAPDPEPDRATYAELVAARERLAQELAEARAKALWYEKTLTARDDALKRAQRVIELLSASGPAKAGKALMGGAKAARRTARLVVRKVKPRT